MAISKASDPLVLQPTLVDFIQDEVDEVGWISGAQSTFCDDSLMVDFASLIHPTIRQSSPVETLIRFAELMHSF
jgi:hypothetical protein